MTHGRKLQRVATGVPGLDLVLDGGLFETGVYIVQGTAGAGKTILANQICFHHAQQGRRAVYFTLLTESHDRMLAFLQPLRFYDAKRVPDQVRYVSGYKTLESEGLAGVVRNIRDVVANLRPALFVVDGLVSAEEVAANDTAFKKFLHEIQTVSSMFRCTVLLLTNIESSRRLQAEHTMVDGIIDLKFEVIRLKPSRSIFVSKLRGGAQRAGAHTLDITDDGIKVWPRLESVLARTGELRRTTARGRLGFGVTSLDAAIGGGIPNSSNTLVLGPSGIGKTVLGMHFLDAGARAGEKGLLFTFYEQAEELVAKARRLGMTAFADAVQRGDIQVVWQTSVEARLDRIANELVRAFEEFQPARVFVDGMDGFQVTIEPDERIQDFFAAIADYFVARGSTMLFTAETRDLIGEAEIRSPFPNASRMCQNIFLLRFAELCGHITRVWSVLKMRDSAYDTSLRLLTITERGVQIGAALANADMLLSGRPLRISDGTTTRT